MTEQNESVSKETDAQDISSETTDTTQTSVDSAEEVNNETNTTSQEYVATEEDVSEEVDPKDVEIENLKKDVKENEDKYLRLYAELKITNVVYKKKIKQ